MPITAQHQRRIRSAEDLPPRLGLVASYFELTGSLMAVGLVGGPLLLLFTDVDLQYRGGPMTVLGWALGAVTAGGFLWTARELRQARRAAGLAASLALAEPLIALARGASAWSLTTVLAAAGIIVLASVWRDLE